MSRAARRAALYEFTPPRVHSEHVNFYAAICKKFAREAKYYYELDMRNKVGRAEAAAAAAAAVAVAAVAVAAVAAIQ